MSDMLAFAVLRAPDGTEATLGHGDLVGRLASAALPLPDGRVSEAHAMVSLRDGGLVLLSLRGQLSVDGRVVQQVPLSPGLRVSLAPEVTLEVAEVWMPASVLGVEGATLPRQILPSVVSFLALPSPRVVRGWKEPAAAHAWNDGDAWTLRVDGTARPLRAGDTLPLGTETLRFVELPVGEAGPSATRQRLDAPLRLVNHHDTLHIHRDGRPAVVLGGRPARLIGELVACDAPVGWAALAEALWPEASDDPALLRSRLDVVLTRVRAKLRAVGIRTDLVSTDGAGTVALVLNADDRVEDRA